MRFGLVFMGRLGMEMERTLEIEDGVFRWFIPVVFYDHMY